MEKSRKVIGLRSGFILWHKDESQVIINLGSERLARNVPSSSHLTKSVQKNLLKSNDANLHVFIANQR